VMGRVRKHHQVSEPGTSAEQTYDAMEYGYNLAGAMESQKYPSGRVVTTSYDAAGRISKVGDAASKVYADLFKYAAHGAIEEVRLGNGLWERTQYNQRHQPEWTKLGTAGGVSDRWQIDYGYGPAGENNGNVRTQTITVPTLGGVTGLTAVQTYTYDALNRIETARETQETAAGAESWKQKFTYDHFGNRRIDGDAANPATSQTTTALIGPNPSLDPATNRISSSGYTYDAAGNLTSTPGGETSLSYDYDSENKQVAFRRGQSTEATYTYDGDGRRVRKVTGVGTGSVTTVFVYDAAGQLVAEYSDGVQPASTGGTSYLTQDHLGSTRVVTGQDKAVKSRHDFLPFGQELKADLVSSERSANQKYEVELQPKGVRQKFTGKERDGETGLDYFGARYYSTSLGRFTSVDPIMMKRIRMLDPQRINLYGYVRNNPIKYLDPTGEDLTVAVTNIASGSSHVNSRPGGGGTQETVKTYKVIITNESGSRNVFYVTRDTNYNGAAADQRGIYGSNSEAPPGEYRGHIRRDRSKGFRIELYDPDVTQSSEGAQDTINAPDGTARGNIQIHVGPGCSQGCLLLTGGRDGRDTFEEAVTGQINQDRENGFGTDIYVNLEDRNNPDTGDLPNGDRLDVPESNSGTVIVTPITPVAPQPPRPQPSPGRRPQE